MGGWVGQAITDPISGPSLSFVFCLLSFGPELDNTLTFSMTFKTGDFKGVSKEFNSIARRPDQ